MCLVYSIRTWSKVWIEVFLWKNKNEIEERASVPNFEKFNYLFVSQQLHSGRGRNFCPCRSQGQYCSSVYHDGNSLCLNNRRALESNSDDSSVSFFPFLHWYANKMYKAQSSTNCTIFQIST